MERCVLNLTIPRNSTVQPGSHIDIWELDDHLELVPHIHWGTAPARVRHLGAFAMSSAGVVADIAMDCASGLFPTFEFACADEFPVCGVDFWQDQARKRDPGTNREVVYRDTSADETSPGIHIVQHWSRPAV